MKTKFTASALLFLILFIFSFSLKSQMLPPSVENKTFDMAVGEWVAEPFEMMGVKWNSTVSHHWVHNHQFLDAIISNISEDGKMKFTSTGYFTCDKDGNMTGWFFDDMGLDGVTTVTGKAENNTVSMKGKCNFGTSERVGTFSSDGKIVEINYTMTMKGQDGKDMTMSGKIVYKKKM